MKVDGPFQITRFWAKLREPSVSSSGGRPSGSLWRRGGRRNEHRTSKPVVPAELFWLVPQDHQHCRGSPYMVKQNTGGQARVSLQPITAVKQSKTLQSDSLLDFSSLPSEPQQRCGPAPSVQWTAGCRGEFRPGRSRWTQTLSPVPSKGLCSGEKSYLALGSLLTVDHSYGGWKQASFMIHTPEGPREFESSFPVCSEKWASLSLVTPEGAGWHLATPHRLLPCSSVLDKAGA